jgi:chromate transporter
MVADMSEPRGQARPREAPGRGDLRELAWVFLKLGTLGFGGPAAHIALMKDEVVERRAWLSPGEFLDLLAATQLIPGPNSTEMAIHVGHRRAGAAGLVVAGASFILPATLIVTATAWCYVRFGAYPEAGGALFAIKPVIIAIVVQALWSMGHAAIRSLDLAIIGGVAVAASLWGANELAVLALAGVAAGLAHAIRQRGPGPAISGGMLPAAWIPSLGMAGAVATTPLAFGLWPMFLVFLKVGSVLFGSGYVLLAFLRGDLVERLGWLTEQQLLDAVAVGQFTPGPVFTTATFIGYLLGGGAGAAVATLGIFLPAFVFVAISGPVVPLLRRSARAGAVLDGLVVGSLALMAAVTVSLARVAIVDAMTAALAVAATVALVYFRINSAWLVLGAGALGVALGVGR